MTPSEVYKESCSNFRHYAKASLTIRIATIAQGIAVLSGGSYLIKESEYNLSIAVSVFGFLLTMVLYVLHNNYQHKCDIVLSVGKILRNNYIVNCNL